jgi:hypothetical protein
LSSPSGVHLLQLAELRPGRVPPFEEVRREVEADFIRRRGDLALRALLARLRAHARIVFASEEPRT